MTNHNIPATRAFLFDLEGTLIAPKSDIVASVNAMLRQTGRAELPLEIVGSYIGHGAPQLMAAALGPSASEASRREALAIFLEQYEQHNSDATRAHPGAAEGLQALAERRM